MTEPIGRTFLYRPGEKQIFEGEEVTKKLSEGWMDSPQPAEPIAKPAAKRRGRPKGSKNGR